MREYKRLTKKDKYYCEDCQFCKLDDDELPYCTIFDKGLNRYYDLTYRAREYREMNRYTEEMKRC